MTVSTSK